jgi:adenylosuccinate lyase
MAYKKNPMRCERVTGLARLVMSLAASPMMTAAEQWLERTLDDSSNKRVCLPEAFLAADAICLLVANVARGLVVYPKVIAERVRAELPFIATEPILMAAVRAGADRQAVHERLRQLSLQVVEARRTGRAGPSLLALLREEPLLAGVDWGDVLDPRRHVGLAGQQVSDFLRRYVAPVRRRYRGIIGEDVELEV